ncbi:MAG: hypothetical protein EA427_03400 [Spirochaetaceae bacterium]|nr:MAG: hypothetical protein EA427_03400 [Spirochaetaceae bacterium]
MTASQRFHTAIGRGVPDRVPVVPKIYLDLAARLTGRDLRSMVEDPLDALWAVVEAGRLCGADAVRQFHVPRRRTALVEGQLVETDGTGSVMGRIDLAGGLITVFEEPSRFHLEDEHFVAFNHYWSCPHPFVADRAAVDRMVVPERRFYENYGCGERQRAVIEGIATDGGEEVALIGDCDTATMAFLVTMRGMERAMFDLLDNPALVHAIMDKGARIAAERGFFNIDLGMRVLRINDSVGNMSVISPEHWREFVFPHLRDLCAELHRYEPEARLYCHICGNVLPILEDLVETGLDCIAPLDPLGGVSPAAVRARVGDAVSLMGGVNTLSFLDSTPAGIIEESRRCIEEGGQRGGFVLGSGCVVPRDAPRENLEALYRASTVYGRYHEGRLRREE